jgi:hypothetical protein
MITVITENGSFEIPRDVVAEGESACGVYAAAEVAKLALVAEEPDPAQFAAPSDPEE